MSEITPGPLSSAVPDSALGVAMGLVAQYSEDAEIIATLRAAEFAAVGDLEGLAFWDDVIEWTRKLADNDADLTRH